MVGHAARPRILRLYRLVFALGITVSVFAIAPLVWRLASHALGEAYARTRATNAQDDLVRITAALGAYRRVHGKLPATDQNVTPALFGGPNNAFLNDTPTVDGVPFYYHHQGLYHRRGEYYAYSNYGAAVFDGSVLQNLRTFREHTPPQPGKNYVLFYDTCCGMTAWPVPIAANP